MVNIVAIVMALLVAGIVGFLAGGFFGVTQGIVSFILVGAVLLLFFSGLSGMNIPFFSRVVKIKKTQAIIVSVVLLGLVLITGFASTVPFIGNPFVTGTIGGIDLGGNGITVGEDVECDVTDELRGKDTTISLNAYDQEDNTPVSSGAVDMNPTFVFMNGELITSTTDTSAYTSLAGFSVGDTITFIPANDTYYGDVQTVCINKQDKAIQLDAHAIAGATDMQMTAFNSDGNPLSAGTSSEDDYTMALGVNSDELITVKLKVNAEDIAFNLGAFASYPFTDVDEARPFRNLPEEVRGQLKTHGLLKDKRYYYGSVPVFKIPDIMKYEELEAMFLRKNSYITLLEDMIKKSTGTLENWQGVLERMRSRSKFDEFMDKIKGTKGEEED